MADSTTHSISVDDVLAAVSEVLLDHRDSAEAVTAETRFSTLGLDSLELAALFNVLEEKAGFEIDPDSIADVDALADLVRLRPA